MASLEHRVTCPLCSSPLFPLSCLSQSSRLVYSAIYILDVSQLKRPQSAGNLNHVVCTCLARRTRPPVVPLSPSNNGPNPQNFVGRFKECPKELLTGCLCNFPSILERTDVTFATVSSVYFLHTSHPHSQSNRVPSAAVYTPCHHLTHPIDYFLSASTSTLQRPSSKSVSTTRRLGKSV